MELFGRLLSTHHNSWLDSDRSLLLLKVPSMPLEAGSLLEKIRASDDRTGLTFRPSQASNRSTLALNETCLKSGEIQMGLLLGEL